MSSITSNDQSVEDIEEAYQKKTQIEHILLRPDTYVGTIKKDEQMLWVYDAESNSMVERKISFNPALYKIFDEILVNASDNKIRDPKMSCIKITIDKERNMIKIWNNGKGIPVAMHKKENMYVPTLIFGHLLTSTNFNDDKKKVVGGRNGFGAKLCNIFSTKFILETSSKEYGKNFQQAWSDNMTTASDPVISSSKGEDFTSVTFFPDLPRFGMTKLDQDIIDLFSRRAYDIAACTNGVTVFLNGQQLPVKTFKDYVELFTKNVVDHNNDPLKVIYEKFSDRWEFAVTTSVNDQFTQISFVNSIATTKGGTHVNYIADQAASKLLEIAKKKIKDDKQAVKLKPAQAKMNMWIFVRALIENPSFDSQTKENMTLHAKDFGSTCVVSDKFITQAAKCGIIEKMTMWANFKNLAIMDKQCSKSKQSKLKGIAKLDDANNAGTKDSLNCTLILTEGDSAKTLAVAGLSVIGRDNYGVFPLRGKLLNVREASSKQLVDNVEINNVIKIMGLQYSKKYETVDTLKTLRYGKIMIMTDQDQDGSHIKGLIINFIHTKWPNLLKYNFLEQFITPIIKATKGDHSLSFYSIPEYKEWLKGFPEGEKYKTKYYKGLGTSTGKEAKEYFSDMQRHLIKFKYGGINDDNDILLAFSKNKADERKEWLTTWMEECKARKERGDDEEFLYGKNTKDVSYRDFVKKELVLYSNMDNERSIPSIMDGLKPGQRKVMFACFKRNLIKELKVAQLAGSVAELSSYHHGEVSLMGTIVNLAQDFVGSNNINLLEPHGQFGTRMTGGKDSASPRYIFTQLSRLAKLIFHPDDMPILKYLRDDNQPIEPEWYVPIIPMVLVNGSDGIGTGWSSKVANYNPMQLINNMRNLIENRPLEKMVPWFRGFKGTIVEICENRYVVNGEINSLGNSTLEITELPVRVWTTPYKENVIETLMTSTDKVAPAITGYKEHSGDTTVRFVIEMTPQKYSEAEAAGFHKFFKLQTPLTCNNMVLFDELGVIRRYNTTEEIMRTFHRVRLEYYLKRKAYMVGFLAAQASRLENQARFIVEKIEGAIKCENVKIKVLLEILVARKYDSDPVAAWKKTCALLTEPPEKDDDVEDEDAVVAADDADKPDFGYLTSMHIIALTEEKKNALLAERDAKIAELKSLKEKTPEQLWLNDLDQLEKALIELAAEEKISQQASTEAALNSKTSGKGMKKVTKKVKINAEMAPSKFGKRIAPVIDMDLLKKVAAETEKKKKATVEKNQKKMMEGYFVPQEDGDTNMTGDNQEQSAIDDRADEDEDEPQTLAQRLAAQGIVVVGEAKKPKAAVVREKKAPDSKVTKEAKKTKTSPVKRKKPIWDSDSDADIIIDPEESGLPRRDSGIKRNAAKDVKYSVGVDEDESEAEAVESERSDFIVDTQAERPTVVQGAQAKKKPMTQTKILPGTTTILTAPGNGDKPKKATKPKGSPKKKATAVTKVKAPPKPKVVSASKKKKGSESSFEADDFFKPDAGEEEIRSTKPRRAVKKRFESVFDSGESDSEAEKKSPTKRPKMIDSD